MSVELSDYQAFRTKFGLAPNDYTVITVDYSGPPTTDSGDFAWEATVDLQVVGMVARNSTILYVLSDDVLESVQYVIDNSLAQIITFSYAECEQDGNGSLVPYYQGLAQQANAEGITWLAASGDTGAAGCDPMGSLTATSGLAVVLPASIPEVTGVGGIAFVSDSSSEYWAANNNSELGTALSYVPETAWGNGVVGGIGIGGGGGGASAYIERPYFQVGFGDSSQTARMVPDVSLDAVTSYAVIVDGSMVPTGGTSAATPAFAGIVALTEQYLLSQGSISTPGLGNVNPNLYALNSNVPSAFHDITTGNNDVPCTIGTSGLHQWNHGLARWSGLRYGDWFGERRCLRSCVQLGKLCASRSCYDDDRFCVAEFRNARRCNHPDRSRKFNNIWNDQRNGDVQGGQHDLGHSPGFGRSGDAEQCRGNCGKRFHGRLGLDHGRLQWQRELCGFDRKHEFDGGESGGLDYDRFCFAGFRNPRRCNHHDRDRKFNDIRNDHRNGDVQGGQHDPGHNSGFWRHGNAEQCGGECGERL